MLGTPEVTGLADALTAASAASEALARQHTVLGAALRTGRVTTDDRAAVNATDNAFTTGYSFYVLALGATLDAIWRLAIPTSRMSAQGVDKRDLHSDLVAAVQSAAVGEIYLSPNALES